MKGWLALLVVPIGAVLVALLTEAFEPVRPRGAVILIICLALAGGLALHAKDAWPSLGARVSVAIALVLLVGIGALLGAPQTQGFMVCCDPTVEIRPDRLLVAQGGETTVAVHVDGHKAEPPFVCRWTPAELASPNSSCTTAIRPPDDLLGEFSVEVELSKQGRSYPSASLTLTATPTPEIRVAVKKRGTSDKVYEGDMLTLRAFLDRQSVAGSHTCVWTRSDLLPIDTVECVARITAPELDGADESLDLTVEVEILGVQGSPVAPPATAVIHVLGASDDYTVFVLDASVRMRGSPFDAARESLRYELDRIQDRTGEVGIEIFGARRPRGGSECRNALPLHRLGLLTNQAAQSARGALAGVVVGDPLAPLGLALDEGLDALEPLAGRQGVKSRLVAIVGGPELCPPETFEQFLSRYEGLIRQAGLDERWFQFEFLTLTVIADFEGDAVRLWEASPETQMRYTTRPFVTLFVQNVSELARVLNLVASIGSVDRLEHDSACDKLAVFLKDSGQEAKMTAVSRHCE